MAQCEVNRNYQTMPTPSSPGAEQALAGLTQQAPTGEPVPLTSWEEDPTAKPDLGQYFAAYYGNLDDRKQADVMQSELGCATFVQEKSKAVASFMGSKGCRIIPMDSSDGNNTEHLGVIIQMGNGKTNLLTVEFLDALPCVPMTTGKNKVHSMGVGALCPGIVDLFAHLQAQSMGAKEQALRQKEAQVTERLNTLNQVQGKMAHLMGQEEEEAAPIPAPPIKAVAAPQANPSGAGKKRIRQKEIPATHPTKKSKKTKPPANRTKCAPPAAAALQPSDILSTTAAQAPV